MPTADEDILRELLHRATDDLHAPGHVAAGIVTRDRRRRYQVRAAGLAAAGIAAGTAVGLAATGGAVAPGSGTAAAGGSAHLPSIRLTAAQQVLYRLSDAAARQTAPSGRYVELTEFQNDVRRESVIDSQTGDVWTFQQGPGVPAELPVARHDSRTAAELAAMPTGPAALRAALIQQFQQEQAAGLAAEQNGIAKAHLKGRVRVVPSPLAFTPDDEVFEEATTDLWNPLDPAALRSALYKVLADTPGVQVSSGARDRSGRPAIEISRADSVTGIVDQTFEDASTGAVLETAFVYPPGMNDSASTTGFDLYLSITSSDTAPTSAGPHGG